jgi:hypothetical protein
MLSENVKPAAGDPVRLPKKKLPALIDVALPAVALGSGAMLFLAVPNIVEGSDFWSYAKALTLAASATVISFAINRMAIERGAPLATTGYGGAGIVSIASILAVGGGLFGATYSGLVFKDVAELQLQEHGTALSDFVAGRSAAAAEAARVDPVMRAIVADLGQKTACEREESCISGRGNGGRGPVTRIMEEIGGRATAIDQQLRAGEAARRDIVGRLNAAMGDYQARLADTKKNIWERRIDVQQSDIEIRQAVAELDEAIPVTLLSAYAAELKSGSVIPGRPAAETKLNTILSRYGDGLAEVITTIARDRDPAPDFPKRTGVSDTFQYIAHFLPVAAIAAVVELVFPIVLWSYIFWALAWDKYRDQRAADAAGARPGTEVDPSRQRQFHEHSPNGGDRRRAHRTLNGHDRY